MKIYISHSINFDFKKELYKPIQKIRSDSKFIYPHEKSNKQYPTKKLFLSKKCNLVIAEISFPSTGQGIELGWADACKIPILCIYRKGSKYSGSLKVITKNFVEYTNKEDLMKKLKEIL